MLLWLITLVNINSAHTDIDNPAGNLRSRMKTCACSQCLSLDPGQSLTKRFPNTKNGMPHGLLGGKSKSQKNVLARPMFPRINKEVPLNVPLPE